MKMFSNYYSLGNSKLKPRMKYQHTLSQMDKVKETDNTES